MSGNDFIENADYGHGYKNDDLFLQVEEMDLVLLLIQAIKKGSNFPEFLLTQYFPNFCLHYLMSGVILLSELVSGHYFCVLLRLFAGGNNGERRHNHEG